MHMLAGVIALLAGCDTARVVEREKNAIEPAPAQGAEAKVTPRPATSESEALLNYFEQVRKLPAAELAKESENARKLFARVRTDAVRMRYAMLLGAPAAAPGDDVRAIELLEPLLKTADGGMRALAALLSLQIQEQRRAHALQQKLDALMSLDKNMIERGRTAP
jgi:hypothetical protein